MKATLSSATRSQEEEQLPSQTHTRLHGRRLWVARVAWLLVFLLVASMVTANAPHLMRDTRYEWQVGEAMSAAITLFSTTTAFVRYLVALKVMAALVFAGTAIFLAWRQADDWMVLFTSTTLLMLVFLFGFTLDVNTIRYPQFLEQSFSAIRAVVPTLMVGSFIGFFFLFPDGHFRPRWTRWVAFLAFLISASVFFSGAMDVSTEASFDSLSPLPEEWGWLLFVYSLFAALAIGFISRLVYYYRDAGKVQRQQMKLVLFGLGTIIAVPLLQSLLLERLNLFSASWRHFISLHTHLIVPLILPLTISMSVLRYRLWHVDLLINRTLVYGALTAIILSFYGLSVGFLSALVPGQANLLTSFIALSVAAVVVVPAHRALRKWADRWLPPSSPPPTEVPATSIAPGMSAMWRLAHLAWVALSALLFWQLFVRLSEIPDILTDTRADYLVRTSLQLLPASAAAFFVRYVIALRIGVTGIFWLTATVIFWRKRNEWFALYVSFLLMLIPFGLVLGGSESGLLASVSFMAVVAQLSLPFLFPDGRFIPRSTPWRMILAALLLLTPAVVYPLTRLLLVAYGPGEWAYGTFIFTVAVMMAAGLVSQVYRYRRVADAVQRQQMKWVLVGFAAAFLWILWLVLWLTGILARINISEPVTTLVMMHLTILATAALPVTIGFSILRYRLWQVDLFINRALVFGSLTLLVTAVYIFVVGVLGVLFQAGGNLLLSILATGLVAILFHPLRRRLQQAVNRRMYGDRDDPATVLSRLGKRLEETSVPGDTLPSLAKTIAQTLKLPYVAIEVDDAIVGEAGNPPLHKYPLVYQSQPIGHLLVAARAAGEEFTANEEQLLRNVARQAGPAVYAEQLTSQLQRSRQRLVTTREEERRRLRRDLHDGLGPQLATLTMKVTAAQNLLGTDRDAVEELLAEVKAESQNAIKEIRRVVSGLRPSALDQLGLLSALQEFVARNGDGHTQVTVQAPNTLPPLPAAVEVAAYRIATEAVTNAVRHAQAHRCTLCLQVNETLHLEISDDGRGLPLNFEPGVGLSSMRERALELGGSFEIRSEQGQGTVLSVRLPMVANE